MPLKPRQNKSKITSQLKVTSGLNRYLLTNEYSGVGLDPTTLSDN